MIVPENASNEGIERMIKEAAIDYCTTDGFLMSDKTDEFEAYCDGMRNGLALASELKAQKPAGESMCEHGNTDPLLCKKCKSKPVDKSLDEAADILGWHDEDEKRCFSQGRAQGWREAIEFLIDREEENLKTYPETIIKEAKRRGILK